MQTIQKVRENLIRWGEFWHYQEMGQGYGGNSVTGRLCETLRTGIWSTGTASQVADRSESIHVPSHIHNIDICLPSLTINERRWIGIKYKMAHRNDKAREERKAFTNLFIARAENKLCGML